LIQPYINIDINLINSLKINVGIDSKYFEFNAKPTNIFGLEYLIIIVLKTSNAI